MAWTTPRTWTDTETVTASIMNTHVRDNLDELRDPGDWDTYTPTVSGFTNVAVTATGYYLRPNQSTVLVRVKVTVDTVTTLGSSTITISLPVNAKTTGMTTGFSVLGPAVRDPNASNPVMGVATYNATGTFSVLWNSATAPQMSRWTGAAPSGQVAGDDYYFNLTYEAA